MAAAGPTPAWLAGTRSREVNAAAPAERALASRLGRCAFPLLAAAPVDEAAALRAAEKAGRLVDLQRLSISYDEAVFAVPPPRPVDACDVVIAVVLVLPNALRLVMYLSTAVWRRREVVSLAVIVGTGFVALLGVILLALGRCGGRLDGRLHARRAARVPLTDRRGLRRAGAPRLPAGPKGDGAAAVGNAHHCRPKRVPPAAARCHGGDGGGHLPRRLPVGGCCRGVPHRAAARGR
eukprot:TRINITY_DN9571_c0_g1_i2.p4 TRINITY_DN9571_c0_g1~~TRINITY_DN9571_c0_g1_i2.p4  ORF type:complete len:236 (-),score=55.15 TRINITY_DN9571_c0_g1_i2:332-1039(-)